MKILKAPNNTWSYKYTCGKCDAELEVEKADVKFHSYPGDFRDPGYETWSATCPICAANFDIPATKIPKVVQIEIQKKMPSTGSYYDR